MERGMFQDKSVLITGGTGSFGQHCIKTLLESTRAERIVCFSRDELKQHEMQKNMTKPDLDRTRFFLGDVRDLPRLTRACHGVNIIIHAAALKQVPAMEYNPSEAIKTNVLGSMNVIDAAIASNVEHVIALSTDKACQPVNLYGATKLCAEKLFQQASSYVGGKGTKFSVVRYGNVVNSRGSVIPEFRKQAETGVMFITDQRMTRFWITLNQAVDLVFDALLQGSGGETFVPKLPTVRILDIAKAIGPEAKIVYTGIRPGEKLHETLIGEDEARNTMGLGGYYIIHPGDEAKLNNIYGGYVGPDFSYSSDTNKYVLEGQKLERLIRGDAQ
jgi:UDP-N-acetylglucosamine 4,6-dehydratase